MVILFLISAIISHSSVLLAHLWKRKSLRSSILVTTHFFSEARFLNELSQTDWQSPSSENVANVDKLFSVFYNKLSKTINKHAPLKPISKRQKKVLAKPWITKGIRKSIKVKNKLLSMGNHNLYKCYRNKILTLTRVSKKIYFHNYFQENLNNIKKTWEGINNLINRKKHKKSISTIKNPQTQGLSYDPLEQANILNAYFASVGHRIASNMQASNRRFSEYLPITDYHGSFVFEPVLTKEIELEILLTPTKKTYGLYSCPTRLLKSARHIIARPLATLINIYRCKKVTFPPNLSTPKLFLFIKMVMKANHVIIDLYLYSQFLIEYLKRSCTID